MVNVDINIVISVNTKEHTVNLDVYNRKDADKQLTHIRLTSAHLEGKSLRSLVTYAVGNDVYKTLIEAAKADSNGVKE